MTTPNPDRERILAFLADPGVPLAFDSSPLLKALGATIVEAGDGRIVLNFEPSRRCSCRVPALSRAVLSRRCSISPWLPRS